jgi:hypothetical protein
MPLPAIAAQYPHRHVAHMGTYIHKIDHTKNKKSLLAEQQIHFNTVKKVQSPAAEPLSSFSDDEFHGIWGRLTTATS